MSEAGGLQNMAPARIVCVLAQLFADMRAALQELVDDDFDFRFMRVLPMAETVERALLTGHVVNRKNRLH